MVMRVCVRRVGTLGWLGAKYWGLVWVSWFLHNWVALSRGEFAKAYYFDCGCVRCEINIFYENY